MAAKLTLKVVPGSSQNKVAGWLGNALKIRVSKPPENGKANKAVIVTLASALAVPRKSITLCSGHTSSTKVVEIQGISEAELQHKLKHLAP